MKYKLYRVEGESSVSVQFFYLYGKIYIYDLTVSQIIINAKHGNVKFGAYYTTFNSVGCIQQIANLSMTYLGT